MRDRFIDLHCHWVAGIDDGARTTDDSIALLRGLADVGFARVIGTPHMRTGMFDNDRDMLEAAYERTCAALRDVSGLPELGLASEHHLDDRCSPKSSRAVASRTRRPDGPCSWSSPTGAFRCTTANASSSCE
ncbi:MAG: CpsB/CapC family capsule biosynthesis tyrosine phosphatase [Myxococcota bacterium]